MWKNRSAKFTCCPSGRSPNLRDLLVSAKLFSYSTNPHSRLPSGFYRCGKDCATCPYISECLTNYTFFSTGETRPIKSKLTCEAKNLICMIQCNRCNLQYMGAAPWITLTLNLNPPQPQNTTPLTRFN